MESSSSVTSAVYEKMRALDTDTLVRIWQEGEQSEYSVVEQEAARTVLVERLGGPKTAAVQPIGTAVLADAVDDDADDDEDVDGLEDDRWASFIARLAGVISWLLLVVYVGLAGFTLYQNLQMGLPLNQLLLQLLNPLTYLLMGGFYFAVLQFAAKGLSMLQDIREYAGYLVDRRG